MTRFIRVIALILTVELLTGCTQYKKLVEGEDYDKGPYNAQVGGYWSGDIDLGGNQSRMVLLVNYSGGVFNGEVQSWRYQSGSFELIEGNMSGTVALNTINFTIDEGDSCTNKVTVSGIASDTEIIVDVSGQGNAVAGCYPSPLFERVIFRRN